MLYVFWPCQSALFRITLINVVTQWECNPISDALMTLFTHGVISVSLLDPGQRHHLHLWEHGRGVPQAPDGPGSEADLPGHLQLHQVSHQTGV